MNLAIEDASALSNNDLNYAPSPNDKQQKGTY